MKPRTFFFGFLLTLLGLPALTETTSANTITKLNNNFALDLPASWSGNVVPTGADIALWNGTYAPSTPPTTGAGVTFGQVRIASPSGAVTIDQGPGGLTLNGVGGVGIDMSSATRSLTINAALTLGGSQQWNVASTRTLTIAGNAGLKQGTNNLTLNGPGTVLFSPAASFTAPTGSGTLTVNGGLLNLSNGLITGSLTNVISSSTILATGGGTVQMTVATGTGTFTQNLASSTINAGATNFQWSKVSGSLWVINLGPVTRNVGGTVNITASDATNAGYKFGNGSNGIIGGFLTINGTDFPKFTNSGTLVSNIGAATPTYVNDTWAAGNNTAVTDNSSQADATTNSLRFAAVNSYTLTLSGTNTISSGGLLVSKAVEANNNLITGGILRGSANGDLIVHQHNTGGSLTIESEIANNAGATALTKSGAGTLVVSGANSFTGGVYLNAGTLQIGSTGALNSGAPNAITFTNNSSAILQLGGINVVAGGLNTTTIPAATPPVVENASATNAVLTVSTGSASQYAGNLQDGTGGGTLGLTKTGAATLTLSGTNSATGPVDITGGTLALSGSTGLPATSINLGSAGILDVTGRTGGTLALGASQTLSGTGAVTGGLSAVSGTTFQPGGSGVIGTLNLGSLALETGSVLNLELPNSGTACDQIAVGTSGGLALGGTGIVVNLSPTTGGPFSAGSGNTYVLFSYSGALSGAGTSGGTILSNTFTVGNPVAGFTYTFADTGSNITLTIGGGPATEAIWQGGFSTSWGDAVNWIGGVTPEAFGDSARFGDAIGSTPATVSLDGNRLAVLIVFDHGAAAYTLAPGTGGTLTLDNGAGTAQINNATGSHFITAPVTLDSNTSVTVTGAADTLALSAETSGNGFLSKSGAGTLVLSATNSCTGETRVEAGVLSLTGAARLDDKSTVRITGGAVLNLNFTGTDQVTALYIAGSKKPNGTYGRLGSGAEHESADFSGDGFLKVVADYADWIDGYGLTGPNAAADFDYDNDGIDSGIEWVIGGNPKTATEAGMLPALSKVPGGVRFVFRRTDISLVGNPGAVHCINLAGPWVRAVHNEGGVTITEENDFYGTDINGNGIDRVTVFIPTADPNHFVKLTVTAP